MKTINIVVYTMKGCPFCNEFKELLVKENIEFFDRDIDEYEDEYKIFTEITKNEFIPALLIIEGDENKHEPYIYVPEKDYNQLNEAVEIVKKHMSNL